MWPCRSCLSHLISWNWLCLPITFFLLKFSPKYYQFFFKIYLITQLIRKQRKKKNQGDYSSNKRGGGGLARYNNDHRYSNVFCCWTLSLGVIGNIAFPSSRNKGKILGPPITEVKFTWSPPVAQWFLPLEESWSQLQTINVPSSFGCN